MIDELLETDGLIDQILRIPSEYDFKTNGLNFELEEFSNNLMALTFKSRYFDNNAQYFKDICRYVYIDFPKEMGSFEDESEISLYLKFERKKAKNILDYLSQEGK